MLTLMRVTRGAGNSNRLSAPERVQAALDALQLPCEVVELPSTTRTAQEAAQAIGCSVGEIAKSIVFRRLDNDEPVLVVTSGVNRVDEKRLAAVLGCRVGKADAKYVRDTTGFAIGGVAPIGHDNEIKVLLDADLMQYERVWAAAGTPNAVFSMAPGVFVAATGVEVAEVAVPMARHGS